MSSLGFSSDELRCIPRVFVYVLQLVPASTSSGWLAAIFAFETNALGPSSSLRKSKHVSGSIFRCLSGGSSHLAVATTFIGSGVLSESSDLLLMVFLLLQFNASPCLVGPVAFIGCTGSLFSPFVGPLGHLRWLYCGAFSPECVRFCFLLHLFRECVFVVLFCFLLCLLFLLLALFVQYESERAS